MLFAALVACAPADFRITADSTVAVEGLADSSRLRVSVAGDTMRIVGRFDVEGSRLVFRPRFPFDPGREYEAVVAGGPRRRFSVPAPTLVPSTRVTRIYPTPAELPENLLRIYVEFSAPMSREGGLPFVHLLDGQGREVKDVFLPLDADFWNREHTRYTLFLDPGRVKRDILPNRDMGRALRAGRRYSIVVDSTWRDGRGQPLIGKHAREFVATGADFNPIKLADWQVAAPASGTRDALVIRFGEPLDHGLLRRAIAVERGSMPVEGAMDIPAGEREWRFTPAASWAPGEYRIVVADFLEDLAGNRVNRPFEADVFQRVDSSASPATFQVPFRVR